MTMRQGSKVYPRPAGWTAVIVAVGTLLLVGMSWAVTSASEAPIVDPVQAHEAAVRGEMTIVDVRRPSEWQATGVPRGAARITMHSARGMLGFLDEIARLTGGDKSMPIALICAAGVRSRYAAEYLRALGYTNVVNIGEGVQGSAHGVGWRHRRLPMNPCPHCASR
jgi:rhodanese-related sulfurtransferase